PPQALPASRRPRPRRPVAPVPPAPPPSTSWTVAPWQPAIATAPTTNAGSVRLPVMTAQSYAGSRMSVPDARLVADDRRRARLAEHQLQRGPAEPVGVRGRIRLPHRLAEHRHAIALPENDLAVTRPALLGPLRQHPLQDAAAVVAKVEAVRDQEPAHVLRRRVVVIVPRRRRFVAPARAHLLQADFGGVHPDQG